MKLGVSGNIENNSCITSEQYDRVVRELIEGKALLQQAAELIREQRDMIEILKQEITRGKLKTLEISS